MRPPQNTALPPLEAFVTGGCLDVGAMLGDDSVARALRNSGAGEVACRHLAAGKAVWPLDHPLVAELASAYANAVATGPVDSRTALRERIRHLRGMRTRR